MSEDRIDAGSKLAENLEKYKGQDKMTSLAQNLP